MLAQVERKLKPGGNPIKNISLKKRKDKNSHKFHDSGLLQFEFSYSIVMN